MHNLKIAVLLFDGFEPLDVFGPVEMLGSLGKIQAAQIKPELHYCSLHGGTVHGAYGVPVVTEAIDNLIQTNTSGTAQCDTMLVPGGAGTRPLVKNSDFLDTLTNLASNCTYQLTVCTGSALLAATGCIDGKRATSNKQAFAWVSSVRPQVDWQSHARWVTDGTLITSSGVSAGTDMTLGFIAERYGKRAAQEVADHAEYRLQSDPNDDPFAVDPS